MDRMMTIAAGAVLLLAMTPEAVAQDAPGDDSAEWQSTVLPQTEEGTALASGVAVGPDSIVAVGQRACELKGKWGDPGRCWGQPWISADGISWEAVEARSSGLDLGPFEAATSGPLIGVEGVAYGPGGFVAYGWARRADARNDREGWMEPALWRSDDGRDWERITAPASFSGDFLMLTGAWLHDIAGNDAGYLLVGTIYAAPAPRAAIWSSADGLNWTLAEDAAAFDIGAYVDTMEVPAAGGIVAVAIPPGSTDLAGALAVGSACPAGKPGAGPKGPLSKAYEWTKGNCSARYWRTDDGVSWQALPFEAGQEGALPAEVWGATDVALADAASVVGAYPRLVLYSEDGSTWGVAAGKKIGRQKALTTGGTTVHALVPKCLAEKCRRSTLQLWSSPDGAAWEPGASQPTMPSGVEDFLEVDAAPFGDRLVVTAGYWTAPRSDLASMVLLSPPLAPPEAGYAEATPDTSEAPSSAPASDTSGALDITLPPADAAPLPEGVAPPVGASIAWVAAADTAASAIHVTDASDDGDAGSLLDGAAPSWEPDGPQLAFECRGGDQRLASVCLSSVDEPANMDVLIKHGWRPRWSPDGSAIAFSRSVIDLGDAWVRDLRSGRTSQVSGGEPEWSPTGEWLMVQEMFVADQAVTAEVVRPDGSGKRVLGPGWNATWSPDGTQVASTWCEEGPTRCTVFATDVESGESRPMLEVDDAVLALRWLPGDGIALLVSGGREGAQGDLYVVELSDGSVRSLTSGLAVGTDLSVSPDGEWLAFGATSGGQRDIYLASRAGGWRQLTESGDASDPTWRPEVMPGG